jgi:hypothetical protein
LVVPTVFDADLLAIAVDRDDRVAALVRPLFVILVECPTRR